MKMIDSLSAHYRQSELLMMFDVSRSSYTYHCKVKDKVDPERDRLKAKVISIHQTSRGAAGSRTIAGQLKQQGETIGRYKVRSLMKYLRRPIIAGKLRKVSNLRSKTDCPTRWSSTAHRSQRFVRFQDDNVFDEWDDPDIILFSSREVYAIKQMCTKAISSVV